MKPWPIASPDPDDCRGSLSLDRASLGGIFVLSAWDVSDSSLRFQTQGRFPIVSNLNMGVYTAAVHSHHLLRCETSQKYLCHYGGSAGKWGDRPGMPSGSFSDSDCIAPHRLPHTSRLPSSRAHNLRAGLSRSLNPSTQSRPGRLPHMTQGAAGSGVRGPGFGLATRKLASERSPSSSGGGVGWAEGSLITLPIDIQPHGYSFHQQPTLHTSIWLWHFSPR